MMRDHNKSTFVLYLLFRIIRKYVKLTFVCTYESTFVRTKVLKYLRRYVRTFVLHTIVNK